MIDYKITPRMSIPVQPFVIVKNKTNETQVTVSTKNNFDQYWEMVMEQYDELQKYMDKVFDRDKL